MTLSCSSHQSVQSTPHESRCDISKWIIGTSNVIHFKIDWIWSMLCVGVLCFQSHGYPYFHWALCRYEYTSEQVIQQSRKGKKQISINTFDSLVSHSIFLLKHVFLYTPLIFAFLKSRNIFQTYQTFCHFEKQVTTLHCTCAGVGGAAIRCSNSGTSHCKRWSGRTVVPHNWCSAQNMRSFGYWTQQHPAMWLVESQ